MAEIRLGGRHCDLCVIVDDDKLAELTRWPWWRLVTANEQTVYAYTRISGMHITMHRLLMNSPVGLQIDHINRNGLDNRLENLRLATPTQNRRNGSLQSNNSIGLKGVRFTRAGLSKPYRATIYVQRRQIHLGSYATPEEAAAAYDRAAVELFGDFASLNGAAS